MTGEDLWPADPLQPDVSRNTNSGKVCNLTGQAICYHVSVL